METFTVCTTVRGAVAAPPFQSLLRNSLPRVPSLFQPRRSLQTGMLKRLRGLAPARRVCTGNTSPFCCSPDTSIVRPRMQSSEQGYQGSPVRTVPVQVAQELLNAGHRYLDVRTSEEFAAGHIESAVNIPYMHKVGSGMTKNPDFVKDVGTQFDKDDELVVGCQMGKRSHMAATELVAAGFTEVIDMAGGYLSWVQSGKPTKVV